jgi:hypothetical protein
MKILYVIKEEPGDTIKKFMEAHKAAHDVTVVDVRTNKNYEEIIDLIDQSEKVISV